MVGRLNTQAFSKEVGMALRHSMNPAPAIPLAPFIIIRHGETDMNRDGLTCGSTDVPLNAGGRDQMSLTAEALSICFSLIRFQPYHSSLTRTIESCEIIVKALPTRCKTPVRHPDLDEQDWGSWEGRPSRRGRSIAFP